MTSADKYTLFVLLLQLVQHCSELLHAHVIGQLFPHVPDRAVLDGVAHLPLFDDQKETKVCQSQIWAVAPT